MTTALDRLEVDGGPVEPWQEAVRGGFPDPAFLSLSGLEQLRTWDRGLAPVPPIARLTGMRPGEAGEGTSTFTMPASQWLLPPHGLVSIGGLAVLADGPLGSAIQSLLPPAMPYTTAELSLTSVRPVRATGGMLMARGRIVHPGRRMALSEVFIEDEAGRLVAHGTSRCVILPPIEGLPPADRLEPVSQDDEPDDPWRRPVMGAVLPQSAWDQYDGLTILQRTISGELPRGPLSYLTGLHPVEVERGSATFVLPATGWLCPPTGLVEGGMIALLADSAVQSAIQTVVPAGTAMASVDLKVNFLRPAPPDGRELTGRGTVVHEGRSLVIANAEVLNADGKRVAMATGSAMLLPGRPASLGDGPEA